VRDLPARRILVVVDRLSPTADVRALRHASRLARMAMRQRRRRILGR
jgi:hypothetical protein